MLDAVVIGAGQAGLGASYYLTQRGLSHIVLERGRIGETWRRQRWDSFALNTPNWLNALPGAPYDGPAPDGFADAPSLADAFTAYAERFALPVGTGVEVLSVVADADANGFLVGTQSYAGATSSVSARNVVVAAGILHRPAIPAFASRLPATIAPLHAVDYRNPDALPPGAVVVVGSAQSGCQIAEDLSDAGRRVYLATGRSGRIPRRYRGRDIDEWLWDMGDFDVTPVALGDPAAMCVAQPQVSGVGRLGHTLSLQSLAADGVTLLGRLTDIDGQALMFDDSLADNIRFADDKSAAVKREIDAYIDGQEIDAPPAETDAADRPWTGAAEVVSPSRLDLRAARVSTLIWCTGFRAAFPWLHLPVLDADGRPLHRDGVSPVPGLYFLGFPWLRKRKSGIICGVAEDAAVIVDHIAARRCGVA